MATIVDATDVFESEVERLGKKYPSVEAEVLSLIKELKTSAKPGALIRGVGHPTYKVRLPNRSARRGKSGGFRVIYYAALPQRTVLLFIYAKTELDNVSNKRIRRMIADLV